MGQVYGSDCCYQNLLMATCGWNCAACASEAVYNVKDPDTNIWNTTLYFIVYFCYCLFFLLFIFLIYFLLIIQDS